MYAQVEKPKENKSRVVGNSVGQKKSNVMQGFGFVDNRPETIAQRKVQAMANNHTAQRPIQKKASNKDLPVQRLKNNITNIAVDYSGYTYNQLVDFAHELRSDKIKKIEKTGKPTYDFTELEFNQVHDALRIKEKLEKSVKIKEAYATRVPKDKKIEYPGIDSCVAVTLYLNTDFKVGVHMVMTQPTTIPFTGSDMINKLQALIEENETVNSAMIDYKNELGWDEEFRNMLNPDYNWDSSVDKFKGAIKDKFQTQDVGSNDVGGIVVR